MTIQPLPWQGDFVDVERTCTFEDDGTLCGELAVLHLAWRDTPEGIDAAWVCEQHRAWAFTKSPIAHHVPAPDCGMPGSRWFDEGCRCDDLPTAVPEREVAERVPAEPVSADQSGKGARS